MKTVLEEPKKVHPLTNVLKNNPELAVPIKEGDSFEAVLLSKDSQIAFFDIEGRGTGVLYGVEMLNAKDILKNIKVGDKCTITVVLPENDEGYIEASLVKALWHQNWQEIKKLKESGNTVMVKISSANTGGLLAELYGIKSFVPVSQLSTDHYPHVEDGDKNKILDELKKFVGTELEVKILDFNSKADKLILSEKEVTGEGVKKSLEKYHVGDVIEVIVSGIADFGVFVRFVDDPNIEGLVHISEIDHKLIDSPKETAKVNDSIKAKIIEIKDGRVSLSFKALKINPWDDAEKYFAAEQEVEGTVAKFNPFGALISLEYDLQGLIHISEFESAEKMKEELEVSKKYTFIVTSVKPAEKRIILKLKK
jgi:small subunit ribosomal protein S1